MDFYIEKIFEGEYPPEAAVWCNERGDCYIEEIESMDGVRRFQIVAVPKPTDEDFAVHVRAERDSKIAETDYLAMPDYPLSDGDRVQLFAYRQALRDIPEQDGFPCDVVWPELPGVCRRSRNLNG